MQGITYRFRNINVIVLTLFIVVLLSTFCLSADINTPRPTKTAFECPPYHLDQSHLDWGKAQVRKMLKDRPEMVQYVREGDDLWNWTVKQFAGTYARGGVLWDPRNPQGEWDSISGSTDPSKSTKRFYIRNSSNYSVKYFHKGKAKTGSVLWWEMVLELFNLRSRPLFDAIDADGIAGRIGRTDYAFEYMAVEDIVTYHYAHDFYYSVWVPNCKKLNLPPMDGDFIGRFGPSVGDGYSRESFSRSFKDLDQPNSDKGQPNFKGLVTEDFASHYRWYVSIYNKYAPEYFTKKGRPIPPAEPSSEIEQKFLDQLLPSALVVPVVTEVKKSTEDIPPPP